MRLRSQWGARPSRTTLSRLSVPAQTVFIHHSVSVATTNADADVRNIQSYHLDGRKYADIAYNLLVHPNGTIFQGRFVGDRPAVGAHTGGHNSNSFGICVIGNYETSEPDSRLLKALQSAIDLAVSKGWVAVGAQIRSHSDVTATACCGRFLREHLDRLSTDTRPVKSVKGVIVKKSIAYRVHTGKLDSNGRGYVDVRHNERRDPVATTVTLNGNDPKTQGYPVVGKPVFLTAGFEGHYVRVTCIDGMREGYHLQVVLHWD